jgi:hypothetical protein
MATPLRYSSKLIQQRSPNITPIRYAPKSESPALKPLARHEIYPPPPLGPRVAPPAADTARRPPPLAANGLRPSLPSGNCPPEPFWAEFGAEWVLRLSDFRFRMTFRKPLRVIRRPDIGVIRVIGS